MLASALRTDPHRLLRKPTAPAIVELREWSRIVESLTRERVRLSNRMCDQLWRYYPEFINVVEDFNVHWALALWNRVPTPAAVRGVRLSTLEKLLKKHRVRRITAEELRDQLTARAIDIDPSAIRAAETHARIIAKQLALVNQQLTEANSRLEALVTQLAEAAPDPDESSEPGQHKEQRDVAILRSLPGVGTVVATLFAEADDASALRCLCGARHQALRQEHAVSLDAPIVPCHLPLGTRAAEGPAAKPSTRCFAPEATATPVRCAPSQTASSMSPAPCFATRHCSTRSTPALQQVHTAKRSMESQLNHLLLVLWSLWARECGQRGGQRVSVVHGLGPAGLAPVLRTRPQIHRTTPLQVGEESACRAGARDPGLNPGTAQGVRDSG